jgi:anti-anti-sigma regulatory factor
MAMIELVLKILCGQGYATNINSGSPAWVPVPSTPVAAGSTSPTGGTLSIAATSDHLSHTGAEEICSEIRHAWPARTVIVDLRRVNDITTAAFAKLVLLRRELLRSGRDLRLKGLHSRVASVWRISKLGSILPLQ